MQVIALSWPSEGAFGKKVMRDFPADDPKRYSWLRAARKSYQVPAPDPYPHPGGNPGANLRSISHRCYLEEVAFVWELTKETVVLPPGCLQGGFARSVLVRPGSVPLQS